MKDTKRRTKLQAKEDELRRRWIAVYDNAPAEFRPALVAGAELTVYRWTGIEARPGANEQNRKILEEVLEIAYETGFAPLAHTLKSWLAPGPQMCEPNG